jgi:hypothetical protein
MPQVHSRLLDSAVYARVFSCIKPMRFNEHGLYESGTEPARARVGYHSANDNANRLISYHLDQSV